MFAFFKASMRSGVGIIAFYCAIAAVAFLLQWFPISGIFLMIFGGLLIIGALVHIMLLHLALAAITGLIGRAWLALPIAYYAGGYYLHLLSVQEVTTTAAAIETANKEQAFRADRPFTYLSTGVESLELLQRFKIDAAYSREASQDGREYGAYSYAKGADCDKGSAGFYYANRYTQPFLWRRDLFPSYTGADKTRQCILLQTVKEADPGYEIRDALDRDKPAPLLYRQFIVKWTALDARTNKVVATVKVGSMTPLPMVQFIVAGCWLNDGAPSWDCGASFMWGSDMIAVGYKKRTDHGNPFTPVVDVETSQAAALGHALGLEPRSPTD
jgi:hypothetical protein